MSEVRVHLPKAKGRYVILCDHASNFVPPELENLGLPAFELLRHIAYDIGAAGIAQILSDSLDSPAIFSPVSRLVIDCNRHLEAPDLIPEISDGTAIPGNANLSAAERQNRISTYFQPYHEAVEKVILSRQAVKLDTIVLSIHSMTENLAGVARPWQIALSSHTDRTLADPLLAALRNSGDITVGDNQPYNLDPAFDYSTPFHAIRRGLPHLQVEFRQDEIARENGQLRWARLLAKHLKNL